MRGLGGWMSQLGTLGRPKGVTVPAYLAARAQGRSEVEKRFHRELLQRNGVYRTTAEHRMDDLFPALLEAARAIDRRPLRVLDVACSMGTATVEMHRALAVGGLACETAGTDLAIDARYVAGPDGCGVLFDADGQVLQVDVGRWATPWRFRRGDRVLRPGLVARARALTGMAGAPFRAALAGGAPGYTVSTVPLLRAETDGVPGLRFAQESILEPRLAGSFDVVRAANILNGDYFPPERLRQMVELLRGRLAEGGVLVVARNLAGESFTRATLFRHRRGALVPEASLNGGSEVAALLG